MDNYLENALKMSICHFLRSQIKRAGSSLGKSFLVLDIFILQMRKTGSERLSDWLKVTQLVCPKGLIAVPCSVFFLPHWRS